MDSHLRLLLIEDDWIDMQTIRRALSIASDNCDLTWAETLDAAIQILQESVFDAVISDLSLPDSEGMDTVASIRATAPDTPVVVLTGFEDSSLAEQLINLGAEDCFLKGDITPAGLNRTIRHAIQRHENKTRIRKLLCDVESKTILLERKNAKLAKLYAQAHDFVDNVSHEFRTPLTVIKEYLSLISGKYVGEVNEEQIRLLNIAEDRTDDLNTMVDDMLDISRLEAGMLCAWRRTCTAKEIIDRVFPTLQRKANVKQVTLQWDIQDELPTVYCDPEKAVRVITNLVVNAIKFCGKAGTICVAVKPNHDSSDLEITVSDNGPGIDQKVLSDIFDRFTCTEQSIRGSTKGFGLGLNIVKELVSLNLGKIDVQSEIGQGSAFRFTLPFADPKTVAQRYLAGLQKQSDSPPIAEISVGLISVDPTCDSKRLDDFDGFMNYCLRANDLVFRVDFCKWVLLVPEGGLTLENCFSNLRKEHDAANRNRPFGPLPTPEFHPVGTWNIDDTNSLMETLSTLCSSTLLPATETQS